LHVESEFLTALVNSGKGMKSVRGNAGFESIGYRGLLVVALILTFSLSVFADRKNTESASSAPTGKESETAKPAIKNFGRIGDHFFRGAQPRPEDYAALARFGVKTILDLRDDPEKYAQECATRAGLKYISLPLSDHDYPAEGSAEKFLSIVNDGANWPVFVHCAGGRHRTGVMTAVYRMTVEGWDVDRAYREMKDYDFYTRWGHKVMKDFVFDYSEKLKEKRQAQLAATAPPTLPTESTPPEKP
jgi:protein tyrosine/serine phosphatase